MKLQNKEELKKYCRSNMDYICKPIRQIIIEFQGLNRYEYYLQPSRPQELVWAHDGILFLIPYTQPWAWMNESCVQFVNWLIDEIYRLFELEDSVPIVSTGFSMGGLEALIYPIYATRKIAAVFANSPVCDLVSHFNERDDLPRTLMNAFIAAPGGMEEGIRSRSPIHQLDRMKDIPYLIVSGGSDDQVNEEIHSKRLVAKMKEKGLNIQHFSSPTMQHWAIDNFDIYKASMDFISGGYQNA